MPIQLAEISNQAMALTPDDRLALITLLWDSLTGELDLPGEREAVALAKKRAEELDSGLVTGLTHDEVMSSLEKVLDEAHLSSES